MPVNARSSKQKGMVDTSGKKITRRVASACASIRMKKETLRLLLNKGSAKGDVFETAKLAGIMAAKWTPMLIPMCHPIELNRVDITFKIDQKKHTINSRAEIVCMGRTGVEMEALTAACAAALTIYDMMKWRDKGMEIFDVMLLYKSGGKTGVFQRS